LQKLADITKLETSLTEKTKTEEARTPTLIPPDSLLTGKNTGGASSQNHIFATPQLKPGRFRGSYWQQKLEAAM
jgi:hypothetical protein